MKKSIFLCFLSLHVFVELPASSAATNKIMLFKANSESNKVVLKNHLRYTYSNSEKASVEYKMRMEGMEESNIFSMQEAIAIQKGIYKKVYNLNDWIKQYEGKLLLKEHPFDKYDGWKYDFSTPLSALRSYSYARGQKDVRIILTHSDPSFIKRLKEWDAWLFDNKPVLKDKISKITPLLIGRCALDGKEFVAILYRMESPKIPKENRIRLMVDYFVYINGKYYLSDCPRGSQFGGIYQMMKMGDVYPAGLYNKLVKSFEKKTNVPSMFYLIKKVDSSK